MHWFLSLEDAYEKINAWVSGYNHFRLHSSLNDVTPAEVIEQCKSTEETDGKMMACWRCLFLKLCILQRQNTAQLQQKIYTFRRIYLFNGTQHAPFGIKDKISGFTTNHNSYGPNLRALLIALEQWVLEGKQPPVSAYPKIANGTLVRTDKKSTGWPNIPGVLYNGQINDGALLFFGPHFNPTYVTGILQEPPVVVNNKYYHSLVPKVDEDDNEIGGIRNTTIRVPLGTYTGWSLRRKGYGESDLNALNGMFIPFKTTKAERLITGDPRLSLEEHYKDHQGYVNAVRKASNDLVNEGFLMPEDAQQIIVDAEKSDVLRK